MTIHIITYGGHPIASTQQDATGKENIRKQKDQVHLLTCIQLTFESLAAFDSHHSHVQASVAGGCQGNGQNGDRSAEGAFPRDLQRP